MELPIPDHEVAASHSSERSSAVALAVALLALNVLDLLLTDFAIRVFAAQEINPLVAPLLGTPWAAIVKFGVPLAVVAMATQVRTGRTVLLLRVVVGLYIALTIATLTQIAFHAA